MARRAESDVLKQLGRLVTLKGKLKRLLRKRGFFKEMPPRSTEINHMERILFFKEMGDVPIPQEALLIVDEIAELLHSIAEHFQHVIYFVLAHYRRCLNFAHCDLDELFKDIHSECYVGLLRGLLRVEKEHCKDLDKVSHYLTKVVRSHIKNIIGATLPAARIPQSRWQKISPEDKNMLIPISLDELGEAGENGDEVNSLENNIQVSTMFPLGECEFYHFVRKLPQPYQTAVVTLLNGDEVEPVALQKLFALHAYLLYKEM